MYIKIVINYCCLFVLNSFDGCFVVSFSAQVLLLHSQTPLIFGVRDWKRLFCVCVSMCGFKGILTMVGREKRVEREKNYFEITLYSSFCKIAFENSRRWSACVRICFDFKSHTLTLIPHSHTYSNKFCIYTNSFLLAVCSPFHAARASHGIYSRIRIYFHFLRKKFSFNMACQPQ